jgi:hypothetical protein
MRRFVYYGASRAAGGLLLDLYPAAAAYSVRKLRTAYTGACIRVRRSSDNAEQDIGFVGNHLDTTSLLAFVGSNNGRIVTWYDQSGNNTHKIQPSASNQPYIIESGLLYTENGKPCISRNSSTDTINKWLYGATTFPTGDILTTNVFVGKRISGLGYSAIIRLSPKTTALDRRFIGNSIENTTTYAVRLEAGNTIFTSGNGYNQSLFSTFRTAPNTDFSARRNGTPLSVVSSGAGKDLNIQSDSAFTIFHSGLLGYDASASGPDSILQEVIWWLSDESSDLPAIETNINNYYAIY